MAMDLRRQIDTIRILNADINASTISPERSVSAETFTNKSYILSDADEELIILVAFTNIVDLQTIKLHSFTNIHSQEHKIDTSPPKKLRVIKLDNINKTFDEVKTLKPQLKIECSPKKLAKGQTIRLSSTATTAVQFKKIRYLAIYIKSNQNDTENTHLNGIKFYGKANGENIINASKMSIKHGKKMVKHNKNQADLAHHNLLKEVDDIYKKQAFQERIYNLVAFDDEHYIREEIRDCLDDGINDWDIIQQKLWGNDIFIDKYSVEYVEFKRDRYVGLALRALIHYKNRMERIYISMVTMQQPISQPTKQQSESTVHNLQTEDDKPPQQHNTKTKTKTNENEETKQVHICDSTMDIDDLKSYCEHLKRINRLLKAYHLLMSTMQEEKLFDIVQNQGVYEHQQILEDFLHIKVIHIDADNLNVNRQEHTNAAIPSEYLNIGRKICKYFEEEHNLKCDGMIKCHGLMRHYKRGNEEQLSTEDSSFRAECDRIHVYFLHSTVKLGIEWGNKEQEVKEADMMDELNHYGKGMLDLWNDEKSMKQSDSDKNDIIKQLLKFSYEYDDIIAAINSINNKKDINQIINEIE
eukprot:328929_1